MGQSLDQIKSDKKKVPKIAVSDIEYTGEKLIIPAGMTAKQAIALLQRRMKYDQEVVRESRTFDYFPWDGAVALDDTSPSCSVGPRPKPSRASSARFRRVRCRSKSAMAKSARFRGASSACPTPMAAS